MVAKGKDFSGHTYYILCITCFQIFPPTPTLISPNTFNIKVSFGTQDIDYVALRKWAGIKDVCLAVQSLAATPADVAKCDRLSVQLHVSGGYSVFDVDACKFRKGWALTMLYTDECIHLPNESFHSLGSRVFWVTALLIPILLFWSQIGMYIYVCMHVCMYICVSFYAWWYVSMFLNPSWPRLFQ